MTVDGETLAAPLKEDVCPAESPTLPDGGRPPTIIDRIEVLSLSGGNFVNRLVRQNDKISTTSALDCRSLGALRRDADVLRFPTFGLSLPNGAARPSPRVFASTSVLARESLSHC